MESGGSRTDPAPATGEPLGAGRRVAVVVGIDTYFPHHRNLANARNDAIAISQHLTADFGFTVTPLLDQDATAAAIRAVLDGWRTTLTPEDDALVFFAGHGTSLTAAGRYPEGYLLPADAAHTPDTWLSEADLIARARTLPAQRVLLILDACYAGTALRLSDAVRAGEREDQVIRILVAGTERQPVLDSGGGQHSVFTRALLDGLDGLADSGQRPDGTVTARELITFVCAEVPWRSRVRQQPGVAAQTPVGGTIQARPDDADFTFVPTRPRLPATILRNLYSPHPADREAAARQLAGLRGAATAPLAARELVRLLEEGAGGAETEAGPPSAAPVLPAPAPVESPSLLAACASALGALGEPSGFGPLLHLLADERPGAPRPAAAEALGRLVATSSATHPEKAERQRQQALTTLVGLLGAEPARVMAAGHAPPRATATPAPDPALREAAKTGLAWVPAAAGALAATLRTAPRPARPHLVDALAAVAVAHADNDAAWPRLPTGPAVWRRYHVARRRVAPRLSALLGEAGAVGAASAIGLALAFVAVTAVMYPNDLRAYLPAVVTVAALPGLVMGVALFGLPRISAAASRRQRLRAAAVGGVLAGLVVAGALWVPNWFLGVGCRGACPPNAGQGWLLSGLVFGPALGLLAGTALPAPGWPHGRRWGPGAAVGLCVLGFTAVPLQLGVLLGSGGPGGDIVVAWAVAGLVFALALLVGWPRGEETGARVGVAPEPLERETAARTGAAPASEVRGTS